MKLSIKRESKEYKVVAIAFDRALRGLEIEPTRYRTLSLKQRRLALCEAIFSTARNVSKGINWWIDRSDLQSKQLWDFTPHQITQHQIAVDALIGLVCLGEFSYVRPLVTYLSFPESRWTILIDSLLRAMSPEGIRGSLFRLPTDAERARWRKWAIEHPDPTNFRDYSYVLLSDLGTQQVDWNLLVTEVEDSSLLKVQNESFGTDWKYFDEKQADYCGRYLRSPLKSYDHKAFAELVERFVAANPDEANFTTIVACVSDWINEFHLTRSTLKDDWLDLVHKGLSSRTTAILYQCLVYPKRDRSLARVFGKRLFSDEVDIQTLTTVVDILTQSQSDTSLYRIGRTLSLLDDMPSHSRKRIEGFMPTITMLCSLWVTNLYSRELESLCILGSEDPKRRSTLQELIQQHFHANDHTLLRFVVFARSPNEQCKTFGQRIRVFYENRRSLEERLKELVTDTASLVEQYFKLVEESFRSLLCLPQSEKTRKNKKK